LPSRDEIVEAIKYLKDNKAAGSDSIAAELLKSGGPSLLNAFNKMIQQVWIGETLPESWTEGPRGFCVQCTMYKKGDKHDCKNYRDIDLPTECIAYRVFAKVLHSRLPITLCKRITMQGSSQANQQQTSCLLCDQILEKATNLISH
jgi:hypothetical protein